MDDKTFWDIIAKGCKGNPMEGDWTDGLVAELAKLPPEEIVAFDDLFDQKTNALYTITHWGAAYLINDGASDDGFYYWRCWVVGMGREVYEAARANPDSLAKVVEPGEDYEAEIYGVARMAWEAIGRDADEFDRLCRRRGEALELKGDDWDYHDDAEVRKRFPNLANLLLTAEDDE